MLNFNKLHEVTERREVRREYVVIMLCNLDSREDFFMELHLQKNDFI